MSITVKTFGRLELYYNGIPFGQKLWQDTKQLIGLLAINHGRCLSREHIADCLWGNGYDRQCQRRISTMLWRLNHLESAGICAENHLIERAENGDLYFAVNRGITLDLAEFQRISASVRYQLEALNSEKIRRLERIVEMYKGDLLQDFEADWIIEVRSDAQQCYLDMLKVLLDYFDQENTYEKVCNYAERFIRIDPYVEAVHIALVRAYIARGQRSLAATRARSWYLIATEELRVRPSTKASQLLAELQPYGTRHPIPNTTGITRPAGPKRLEEMRSNLGKLLSLCQTILDDASSLVVVDGREAADRGGESGGGL